MKGYLHFFYFSHLTWKEHSSLLIVYKNKTFYKQQIGGALVAGTGGFSRNSTYLVLINIFSKFSKDCLTCAIKSKNINGKNLVFGIHLYVLVSPNTVPQHSSS